MATFRKVRESDEVGWEPVRVISDEGEELRDVELEDAVGVQLITGLGGARLTMRIESELGRLLGPLGAFHDHARFCGCNAGDLDRRSQGAAVDHTHRQAIRLDVLKAG